MLGVMPVICVNGITAGCHVQISAERLTNQTHLRTKTPATAHRPF
jgi:hypothetical protein